MAFLGTIGTFTRTFVSLLYAPTSTTMKIGHGGIGTTYTHDWQPLSGFGEHFGDIIGITMKDGKLVSRPVHLYLRNTGEKIASKVSDIKGDFSFINLDNRLEYYVVVVDDNISVQYNAKVVDKITPN